MIVYSGDKLQKHFSDLKQEAMSQTNLSTVYERDFVNSIRKFCFHGDVQKVFIVSGFRAAGKTFGLLQAVDDYDDTLYITAQTGEKETGKDYIEFLRNSPQKNIIIDEYTWIKDNRDLSYYLWTLVENGKRVAITGTHTLALDYLEKGELIHRTMRINVNMFTYGEFCRIYQKKYSKESCTEFLKTGGIFKKYAIENFQDMKRYIQEAVIEDLTKFMNLEEQEAKAIVYDIMYLAVCDSSENKIKNPQNRKENPEYRKMLTNFDIDPKIIITPFKFKTVSAVLEKARFIVKTYNAANQDKYKLHLVNPSLTYQMASAVFDDATAEKCLAKTFEACALTFMSQNTEDTDYIWYTDLGNSGILIVIVNPNDHLIYLFDPKLQETASLAENSILISKEIESLFVAADIGGRYVICSTKKEKCGVKNGKPVIFTRLDSGTLQNYRNFDKIYKKLLNGKK